MNLNQTINISAVFIEGFAGLTRHSPLIPTIKSIHGSR